MRNTKIEKTRMQKRRKKQINKSLVKIISIAVLIFVLLCIYLNRDCDDRICYTENSNVDYKVHLQENDFYEKEYIEKDNRYIASLIKDIIADFNYELNSIEKGVDYSYSYSIDAEVNVKETKNKESIYNIKEELLKKENLQQSSNETLKINENITIDYNHYNDSIKRFVSTYGLDNIDSTLKVSLHVKINGLSKEIKNNQKYDGNEYVVALEMPLTTKTIGIEIDSDIVKCNNQVKVGMDSKAYIILSVIIIASILEIYLIINLLEYVKGTKTPEDMYKNELSKIKESYGEYIQKINNRFNLTEYNLVFLDVFEDMLKIRDTIQEPILMRENREKNSTYFMIPDKSKILYVYELNVDTIKKNYKK